MDPVEITVNYTKSAMDHNEHSTHQTEGVSSGGGGGGGDSNEEHSLETEKTHDDHSDDKSCLDDVAHEGTGDGSNLIVVRTAEGLRNVIELGQLSEVGKIHILDLAEALPGSIAEALASRQMSALQELCLAFRLENDQSEAIGNALTTGSFQCLTEIDLELTKIGTRGVEALGRAIQSGNLEKLERLILAATGIDDKDMSTLATAFQHGATTRLPNLGALYLSRNPFMKAGLESLVQALISGRLDSLAYLLLPNRFDSSKETAEVLISAHAINNCLTVWADIGWNRFSELERRYKQLRIRNKKNKNILAGLVDSKLVQAEFGKVFLCGSPKVGKTTLSRTLQRGRWEAVFTCQRKRHEEKRTRGIEISNVASKSTLQIRNPITLLVWDMAGQQDYHLVHNAFFPDLGFSEGKATTFVIVCNSGKPNEAEQDLAYWLQYIASSCHKITPRLRHVFVVLNKYAGDKEVHQYSRRWESVLQTQRDRFHGYLDVHPDPFILDVRRRSKVIGFKKVLLQHSASLLTDEKVHEVCQAIRLNLIAWSEDKKQFPVLDWENYVQKVQRSILIWPENIIEAATKYLNEAGVVIYIDKKFPSQWGIPYQRLVVLDVNWFCKDIVGEIFLSEDMVDQQQHPSLFRKKVNPTTGSISIPEFQKFFKSSEKDFQQLITIMLWLGLCYKGDNENIFIPSLINIEEKPGDPWQYQRSQSEDDEEQWVMGFSVEHKKCEMTLAPMSLWHRFQVALAQTLRFNGEVVDNDFVARKYLTTFTADHMYVRIEVDAAENNPTFHEISFFVTPKSKKDELEADERQQQQVDLADSLVDILLGLWDDTCGGVEYVRKVVWPWPSSQSRPEYDVDRNKEVAEIQKSVRMHGLGRKMNWTVGNDSAITEAQLLSTNDKERVIKSLESDMSIVRERRKEAVSLGIYPAELMEDSVVSMDKTHVAIPPTNESTETVSPKEPGAAADEIQEATQPVSSSRRTLAVLVAQGFGRMDEGFGRMDEGFGRVEKKLNDVDNRLKNGFDKVLKEQKLVFRKVQDTERFFEEDKDRTCPNLIYLGEKDSGAWVTLKQALSPAVYARLNFACEAKYNDYRPHFVVGQKGVDISAFRPSLKKIIPWLKVSLTVLSIAAKIGVNFVAPGVGAVLPNFQELGQASSLLESIEWATDFSKAELDKLTEDGIGLHPNAALWNPQDVYGESRRAITQLIGKLSSEDYENKFGLRKVCLRYRDGSLHGIAWICSKCLQDFRRSNLVSEA